MTSSPMATARCQHLLDLLAQVPDPRKKRGRRHALAGLLPVGIAVVIAGSKSFAAIGWSTLAHVILCWLALLLIRVAENHTGQTWPAMRRELQRIAIGTFTGPVGTFRQRTDITKTTRDLLIALKIDAPRKIHELTTPQA
jgi:DDE family transposase